MLKDAVSAVSTNDKDPVNPCVAKTDPVTIKSGPKFEPVIISDPDITAGVLAV